MYFESGWYTFGFVKVDDESCVDGRQLFNHAISLIRPQVQCVDLRAQRLVILLDWSLPDDTDCLWKNELNMY